MTDEARERLIRRFGYVPAYCRCGARFDSAACVGGKVPEHRAEPAAIDPPGYKPGRCPDSGRAPGHVGEIL